MQYKLNSNILLGGKWNNEIEAINHLYEAIKAIYYFLEVGQFSINEELYNQLSADGKQFFIGVNLKDERKI